MDDKTIPISTLDSDRKMSSKVTFTGWGFGSQNKIPVRDVPKGMKVIQANSKKAEIEIPSAIKYWWASAYVAVIPFFFFIALPLTMVIFGSFIFGMRLGVLTFLLTIILPVVLSVVFFIWLRKITHPKILLKITPSEIHVGDLQFDRADFHGFRIGSSETQEGSGKESWVPDGIGHNQLMWTALRPQIGRWGEELPYMVPKTVANDYVIFLNEVADQIGAPEPSATDANEGRREQIF